MILGWGLVAFGLGLAILVIVGREAMGRCAFCPSRELLGYQDADSTLDDLRALGILRRGECICEQCRSTLRQAFKRVREHEQAMMEKGNPDA